jgi:GTP-binding protein
MFADHARIIVKSGKGGDGHVSFRREKFVPAGGPDGGDGGNGGSVVFRVDPGANTLAEFRNVHKYAAENGEEGSKKKCRGKSGSDIIIKVPEGTVIKDAETGKVIMDMSGDTREYVLLKGGLGGNGNQHYATSTMQAPRYAQPGQPAREMELELELKVIADVGIIGFPNVGKSTLLSKVSNAKPEIADYHFTTISPHLGVVDIDGSRGFVMADIPGLIEGASEGAGLGHEFLRHIQRTRVLVHVVDAASIEERDPVQDVYAINKELAKYDPELIKKPQIIAANKVDMISPDVSEDPVERLKKEFEPEVPVYPIAAISGNGVRELVYAIQARLNELHESPVIYETEEDPEKEFAFRQDPYTVTYDRKADEYVVEGPKIEKMLSNTNLDAEKGFIFFQKFLKENGIIKDLKAMGMKEGDTVRLYGHSFEYYDD